MKLYILRHGQAEPFLSDDFSRPLTAKGRGDVKALAQKVAGEGVLIDRAVVSPFVRTQQTFDCFIDGFGRSVSAQSSDQVLSESSVQGAIDFLAGYCQQFKPESLLLVSHQPLVSSLISMLLTGSSQDAYSYPMMPASMAVLTMDIPASNIAELDCLMHSPYE